MKNIYRIILFFLIVGGLFSCVDDPEMDTDVRNAKVPTINTLTDDQHQIEKLATIVSFYAEVVSGNGLAVQKYGVCWGLESEPTIEKNDTSVCGKGLGQFKGIARKLKPNTQYYLRPYATNAKGTNYGKEIAVNTTEGLGIVATVVVRDSIKAESVICGGKITIPGEGTIIERGVYLTTPTTQDSIIPIQMEADSFVCKIIKLDTSTTYTVNAFVKNEFGVFKGEPLTFTTTNGLASVTSLKEISVGYTNGSFEAEVVKEGDSIVTVRGLCWGTVSGLTIAKGDTTINGSGKGIFSGKVTKLKSDQMYYVRAYATNAYGTAYSNEISFLTKSDLPRLSAVEVANTNVGGTIHVTAAVLDEGATNVTESGISYSLTKGDKVGDTKMELSSGKASFEGDITNLKGGLTYYIKAYAINKDGIVTYGPETSYKTPDIFFTKKAFGGNNQFGNAVAVASMDVNGYVLGGDIGAEKTSEFLSYRADKDEWLPLSPFPDKRKWQTAINVGYSIIVFGGIDNSNARKNDLYAYLTSFNNWEKLNTTGVPDPIYQAAGCEYKGNVCLVGGLRDTVSNEVWTVKPSNGESWKKSIFPEKQCRGIAVVADNKIYAGLGNTNKECTSYSNNLYVSENGGSTWKLLSPISKNVRCGVAYGSDIYVTDTDGYIWKYTTSTNLWVKKSQLPFGQRDIYCMFTLGDLIYLTSGTAGASIISYDPSWDN